MNRGVPRIRERERAALPFVPSRAGLRIAARAAVAGIAVGIIAWSVAGVRYLFGPAEERARESREAETGALVPTSALTAEGTWWFAGAAPVDEFGLDGPGWLGAWLPADPSSGSHSDTTPRTPVIPIDKTEVVCEKRTQRGSVLLQVLRIEGDDDEAIRFQGLEQAGWRLDRRVADGETSLARASRGEKAFWLVSDSRTKRVLVLAE